MFKVGKNTQHLLTLLNKTPGMLYMIVVCVQNCLFIFKIDLIGKFFKPWIYPYTPGMLYIYYVNLALHKQRIF